jgi:hypothetical protein
MSFFKIFSSTKSENRKTEQVCRGFCHQREGGDGGEWDRRVNMAQKMGIHVYKCKKQDLLKPVQK